MDLGLYLHIPFCIHKCGYCNFASGNFSQLSQESYVDALLKEIDQRKELKEHQIKTIFIGGGTPSFLENKTLKKLLDGLQSYAQHLTEWTIENNPGSLDEEKIFLYQKSGVTRLSMGVQSFDQDELNFLERQHNPKDAFRSLELLEQYYPGQWNADLIYGLPEQKESSWQNSLERILEFQPKHISLYELTYENETSLGQQLKRGELILPEDEKILALQEWAIERLKQCDLQRYEVSNFAQLGFECQHNLKIWQGMNFLGCGNGAHSRFNWRLSRNTSSPAEYINCLNNGKNPLIEEKIDRTVAEKLSTILILGLRCKEGVSTKSLKLICDKTAPELWVELPPHLKKMLIFKEKGLYCRPEYWNVLDQIVIELENLVSF